MADEPKSSEYADVLLIAGVVIFLVILLIIQGLSKKIPLSQILRSSLTASSTVSIPVPGVESSVHDVEYQHPAALAKFTPSPQQGSVVIEEYAAASAIDPRQEYIVLYANPGNVAPITISGWRLVSVSYGTSATIPFGVSIPHLGAVMTPEPISLFPGELAVVSSGPSPIGVSFRENVCSGYLSQFQEFVPSLSLSCPFPQNELSRAGNQVQNETQCQNLVASLAPCTTITSSPSGVSRACASFMEERFTYNGCTSAHQNDAGFARGQWRIYESLHHELWANGGDVLALLDQQGKLVASVSY